jgi:hypothetical protein
MVFFSTYWNRGPHNFTNIFMNWISDLQVRRKHHVCLHVIRYMQLKTQSKNLK